jgi:hypothetical protein
VNPGAAPSFNFVTEFQSKIPIKEFDLQFVGFALQFFFFCYNTKSKGLGFMQEGAPGNDRPFVPAPGKKWHPFRLSGRKGSGHVHDTSGAGGDSMHREDSTSNFADSRDWTGSLLTKDASPDVVATSPWQIFGCKNGLRLFKETTDDKGNLTDKLFLRQSCHSVPHEQSGIFAFGRGE